MSRQAGKAIDGIVVVLLALALLLVTAHCSETHGSGQGQSLIVDGNPLGTTTSVRYDAGLQQIHITTREVVVGCQQDHIFYDQFQQGIH